MTKTYKLIYPEYGSFAFFKTREEAEKELHENASFWGYPENLYKIKEVVFDWNNIVEK